MRRIRTGGRLFKFNRAAASLFSSECVFAREIAAQVARHRKCLHNFLSITHWRRAVITSGSRDLHTHTHTHRVEERGRLRNVGLRCERRCSQRLAHVVTLAGQQGNFESISHSLTHTRTVWYVTFISSAARVRTGEKCPEVTQNEIQPGGKFPPWFATGEVSQKMPTGRIFYIWVKIKVATQWLTLLSIFCIVYVYNWNKKWFEIESE